MIEWFIAGIAFGAFITALVIWLQAAINLDKED